MPVLSEDYGDALANDGVTYSDDFVFGEDESVLLGTLQIYLNSPLLCSSDDNQDCFFYMCRKAYTVPYYNNVLKVAIVA